MDYFEDRLKSKGGGEFEKSGTCMGFYLCKIDLMSYNTAFTSKMDLKL
jgi:hypothetical protein